jgi:uncharacterized secreted protein with C-terminal beta-propeller domain
MLPAGGCKEEQSSTNYVPKRDDGTGDQRQEDGLQTVHLGLYSLQAAQSCDDVADLWRAAAVKYMEEMLEANKQEVLSPDTCWNDDEYWYGGGADAGVYAFADARSAPAEEGDGDKKESAKEYSETNTQEVGVDEADYLKNDGTYIYILANNQLQIIEAWPPEDAHTVSKTELEGIPRKLYVHKDVAVVYSSLGEKDGYSFNECTYGYDCEFTGDGLPLQISVFDITDVENPQLVREVTFEGSYLSSRRIEDFVYSIIYFTEPPMPDGVKYVPDEWADKMWDCVEEGEELPYDEDDVAEAFETLRLQNVELIDSVDFKAWLPKVEDTWYVDGVPQSQGNPLADCNGFYLSQTGDGLSLMTLASFDLTKLSGMTASTVVAKPGAVYGSKQSLYVATRHYKDGMSTWFKELAEEVGEATCVHKFLLAADSPKTAYAGSGLAKGRVLNQFAMSEHNGFLRLATTTGHLPDPDVHNTLIVLEPKDKKLVQVGILDQIAPTEDIRSVRFSGDLGFVVTFKKTDPLFVIDLSDPTAPAIKGELKIPGFSTYMHFMDKEHILSIGYDADDQGSFAWFQGIMLQVFDVTDITNPQLMHKEVIGTRGTTSEAATNHLAFNYFKAKHLLGLPMAVCEESEGGEEGGGSYGEEMTFNGLMVYEVTVDKGFTYVGGISHEADVGYEPQQEDYYYDWEYDNSCYNWWSDSASKVQRSIFMDDYVFSVAADAIKIAAVSALDQPVASVPLL